MILYWQIIHNICHMCIYLYRKYIIFPFYLLHKLYILILSYYFTHYWYIWQFLYGFHLLLYHLIHYLHS